MTLLYKMLYKKLYKKIAHKNATGYLMIELVIYCALLFFICSICYSWVVNTHVLLSQLGSGCNNNASLHAGLALLYRDIQSALPTCDSWQKCTTTEIIWLAPDNRSKTTNKNTHQKRYIGWRYIKNKLQRTEGVYCFDTDQWENAVTSTVAVGDLSMQFNVIKSATTDTIGGVEIKYMGTQGSSQGCFAALRNREFTIGENKKESAYI